MKSQYRIGLAYRDGRGLQRDYRRSADWFKKAANQKYKKAFHTSSYAHQKGLGIPRDNMVATGRYRLAVSNGYAKPQYPLAKAFSNGNCVKQDHVSDLHGYTKAAKQGPIRPRQFIWKRRRRCCQFQSRGYAISLRCWERSFSSSICAWASSLRWKRGKAR